MPSTHWDNTWWDHSRGVLRRRVSPEDLERRLRRRIWSRQMAKVALAGSIVTLGVIVVEMGRLTRYIL